MTGQSSPAGDDSPLCKPEAAACDGARSAGRGEPRRTASRGGHAGCNAGRRRPGPPPSTRSDLHSLTEVGVHGGRKAGCNGGERGQGTGVCASAPPQSTKVSCCAQGTAQVPRAADRDPRGG